MSRAKRVVICGGGAIGVAIAYFLGRRGARPIVIERHAVAGAASGKSGGFLAQDWCRGSDLDRLARRSFELHGKLSVELHAFTTGLMRAAEAHGAVLRHGTVVDLVHGPSGAVGGVALSNGDVIEADAVVIAMGPWSILAARWLPLPAVF